MKMFYIFTRLPNAYAPKRMLEEIQSMGHSGKIVDYLDITFEVEEGKDLKVFNRNIPLSSPDVVIFRAPGVDGFCGAVRDALLFWLKQNNVRVLNEETFSSWSVWDKLTQHLLMQKAGVPFVNSFVFTDPERISIDEGEYPVIVKSYLGSHGDGVKKVTSEAELLQLSKSDSPFLKQPFLPGGRDVRVIVLGGQPVGAMQRIAQGGNYLTNYSAGGEVELFDLTQNNEVGEIAVKAASVSKCEYSGVDLMQDVNGNWKVLEVNRSCQFEGFEQATGDNVAKKIISHLLS
jgi:RimK family alpha-L-glutamate ligase